MEIDDEQDTEHTTLQSYNALPITFGHGKRSRVAGQILSGRFAHSFVEKHLELYESGKHMSEINLQKELLEMFNNGDVYNNVSDVFMNDNYSLLNHFLLKLFRVSYSYIGDFIRTIKNLTTIHQTYPALPLEHTQPRHRRSFRFEQVYEKVVLGSHFKIDSGMLSLMKRVLGSNIRDYSPFSDVDIDDIIGQRSHDKGDVEKYIEVVLGVIQKCFEEEAYTTKISMDDGIVRQVANIVLNSAIPFAYAYVCDNFHERITETTSNIHDWPSMGRLRDDMQKLHLDQYLRTRYVLTKQPERAIEDLVELARNNICRIAGGSENNSIINGHQIRGRLICTKKAYKLLMRVLASRIAYGTEYYAKPIYTKPFHALKEGTSNDKHTLLYKHDRDNIFEMDPGRSETQRFIDDIETNRRKQSQGHQQQTIREAPTAFVRYADRAKRFLQHRDIHDVDIDAGELEHRKQYEIANLEVIHRDQPYILFGGTAFAINMVDYTSPNVDMPYTASGQSSAFTYNETVVGHVSLGDICGSVITERKHLEELRSGSTSVHPLSVQTPINRKHMMSLPSNVVSHEFGADLITDVLQTVWEINTLESALLLPELFVSNKLADNLNVMLSNSRRYNTDSTIRMQFDSMLRTAKTFCLTGQHSCRNLLIQHYRSLGENGTICSTSDPKRLESLYHCELHPFFQLGVASDRRSGMNSGDKFKFVRRTLCGEVPITVVDLNTWKLRALNFLEHMSVSDRTLLEEQIQKLKTVTKLPFVNCANSIKYREGDTFKTIQVLGPEDKTSEVIDSIGKLLLHAFNDIYTPNHRNHAKYVSYLNQRLNKPDLIKGNESTFKYMTMVNYLVVIPYITNGCFQLVLDDTFQEKDTQTNKFKCWRLSDDQSSQLYSNLFRDTLPKTHLSVPLSCNMQLILRTQWPPAVKLAALMTLFVYNSPTAIQATLRKGMKQLYSVDFFKADELYNEQVVATLNNTHDLLLSPGRVTIKEVAGKNPSMNGSLTCNMFYAHNTLGAPGVKIDCACPNQKIGDMARDNSRRPIISCDSFWTPSSISNPVVILDEVDNDIESNLIQNNMHALKRRKQESSQLTIDGRTPGDRIPSEWVSMLRPSRMITSMPISILDGNPFCRFGGLYWQMYTANGVPLDSSNGITTATNNNGSKEAVCKMTHVLESLFNRRVNVEVKDRYFNKNEIQHMNSLLTRHEEEVTSLPQATPHSFVNRVEGLLNNASISLRQAQSVPYTASTDLRFAQSVFTRDKHLTGQTYFPENGSVFDYAVISPFSVYEQQ